MTDYQRGLQDARLYGDDPSFNRDNESREYWRGFADYMREI